MKTLTFTERDPETEEQEKLENKQARARAEHFAGLLAPYLAAQFGYKRNYVTLGLGATVNARTLKYDLYLRVTPPRGPWAASDCLVIARIGFTPARKGHGRRFMAFLAECAERVGYSKIGIESTNEESEAFGAKFGLQRHRDGSNLIGTVEEIKKRIIE
jgi:GNAT superfamily N-acetyltransferase